MAASSVDPDLARRLEAIRHEHGDTVRVDQIGEIVQALLTTMTGDLDASDLRLYQELAELARYIQTARAEIASLRPQDIQAKYIASATDELDAIVGATETATNEILDACEKLENATAEASPEVAQLLTEATTAIYEACNFQDITGQRITKVVKALKHIEEKIDALVAAFGPDHDKVRDHHDKPPAAEPQPDDSATPNRPDDDDLLNGPQLPENASRQADIDALLASFD